MQFNVNHGALDAIDTEALVVYLFDDEDAASLTALSGQHTALFNSLKDQGLLASKVGQVTPLIGHTDLPARQVLLIGAGSQAKFGENAFIKVITATVKALKQAKVSTASVALDDLKPAGRTTQWCVEKATELMLTSLYQYDTTKSKKADANKLERLDYLAVEQNLDSAVQTGRALAHGMNVARELGNLPANICNPDYLVKQAHALADAYDEISVEVLGQKEMEALGMGSFLAVTQGSDNPPYVIVMKYSGAKSDQKPHVLVGKGLTFDSGGISIKPAAGMEEMKYDMLGAASVFGTLNTLAELKPALNVIGVICAAENMVSGGATRPGDVVTSLSGKTIEILNTDAEGRLVLCDALTYVERFEPASVVDIATLTGAIIIGLGHHPTAVYANNEELQQQLVSAGQASWDRGWPMPLWEEYGEELESPYADLRNIGAGRAGGSITAAAFLSEFTRDYNWAHLDIAGTGWTSAKEGATGRPVGMLTRYLLDRLS
ncbi:leucyl aminopeptidase [Saccharospirillum mangrovi]|uniref:leucyl aminopeptidase n=1 Tax=Saccharospirillum mangrovi TaxID=2161747 RepID=UPI000D3ABFB9|nr:leucyl aminopeptidase [Saccharospirillum mangrovi]